MVIGVGRAHEPPHAKGNTARSLPRSGDNAQGVSARSIIRRLRGAGARSLQRVVADAWPLLQGTGAATAAWLIAKYVLDHPEPFFAPIAALVALNTSLGERGRNALRLLHGVIIGIAVGELTLLSVGGGYGSLAVAILAATVIARAFSGARIAVAQAASSAILVVALADAGAGVSRLTDALIGAGVALVFSQFLFSPEPVRLLRRAETAALAVMADGLSSTAKALEHDDDELAEIAIAELRDLRDDLSELGRVRRASTSVARRSLVWRSRLGPVVQEKENAAHLDLLGSSCLLLARTAASIDSAERATLAPHVRELAEALKELAGGLGTRAVRQQVADRGLAVAGKISADGEPPNSPLAAAAMSVRMVATDLMVFAGIESDDAVAAVREGIQSRHVPAPPTSARLPFSLLRWLRRLFGQTP
jgi:FtsH-binding integral membrane protein